MSRVAHITILLFLSSCGGKQAGTTSDPTPDPEPNPQPATTTLEAVGLQSSALDRAADPCNDFYQFACGGWLAATEIPADRSGFGRFTEIFETGEKELRKILDELASKKELTPDLVMVRDFHGACMDEKAIEAAGRAPLDALLKPITSARTRKSLTELVALLHNHGVGVGFSFDADADFKDATKTIAHVGQGGLGLPDRDYYLSDDASKVELRGQYADHIVKLLSIAGWSKKAAQKASKNIVALETRLAKASKTRVERRDIPAMYNKIDRAGLEGLAPRFDWKNYFGIRGNAEITDVNVGSPDFIKQLGKEIGSAPMATWREYFSFHAIRSLAMSLPKAYVDEAFAMSANISGQKELRPRWKRCLSATNQAVGEFLAKPFLERMFPGVSKESAIAMVNQISTAFVGTLAELEWMSPATKDKAATKRQLMAFLIGYPDKFKAYDFKVEPAAYATSVLNARAWEERRTIAKVGKPVDRAEWYMLPQTVNAYYDPLTNQMAFPAGILQPPFFGVKASPTVNLGGMGMIVGHELTHGFDDQGSQFAGDGNMKNWWQEEDLTKFKAKSQCVIDQYEKFEPLPGANVNGKLTLGENIADIGGVKLAYRAHRSLIEGKQPTVADGFTDDQQFFLAVGQAWCAKRRDKRAKQLLVTDPHSPPKFRVNGALTNQPEFAEAFSCKADTPMNPANRCEVW